MEMTLTILELRIIGSLIEKERATPEQYPLTVRSLMSACNQKSSRDPVMNVSESQVETVLNELRNKGLVTLVREAGARVDKYAQVFKDHFSLTEEETVILAVLMLRGPQTAGELKNRSGRLYDFQDVADVEKTLHDLAGREDDPFVIRLQRRPGERERRYQHLLGDPVDVEADSDDPSPTAEGTGTFDAKVRQLTETVDTLNQQLADLNQRFEEFKKEFE